MSENIKLRRPACSRPSVGTALPSSVRKLTYKPLSHPDHAPFDIGVVGDVTGDSA